MIVVGVDIGAKNIKIVILKDGEIIAKDFREGGLNRKKILDELYESILKENNIKKSDVDLAVATGAGKESANFAKKSYTIMACNAIGISKLLPSVRTVIDVGAEEARTVRLDEKGKVIEFVKNEKCAAGAGSFIESMSRALEMTLEEFCVSSMESNKEIPINAQCVIFAESEVVSLIHENVDRKDIAKAVLDAMAVRVSAMSNRIKMEENIALAGGVAYCKGFVKSLETSIKKNLLIPEDPEYLSSIGAAYLGERFLKEGEGE